jgi:hypothetical protein
MSIYYVKLFDIIRNTNSYRTKKIGYKEKNHNDLENYAYSLLAEGDF